MAVVETVFWLSAFGLLYSFVGYPLMIGLLALARPRPICKGPINPVVSLIVSVHNEQAVIEAKIMNCLALDYPREKLEIIVASDGSTDRTNEIVRQYAARGVRLVNLPERKGKTAAQNLAVSQATGEIIVFSDASIILEPDAIRQLVRNFADASVGCVSCEDKTISIREGRRVEDEGLYVRYEMMLRRWESQFGSIVGASGCLYALRKRLWRPAEDFLVVDFTVALDVREQGFRPVSEPKAIAYVKTVASSEKEFARRVRTATRGLVGLLHKRRLLNPFKFGFFSIQLFSHKVLRFIAPFLLLLLLVTNVFLVPAGTIYLVTLIVQGLFYTSALFGLMLKNNERMPRAFSFPFYFLMVNWAIVVAWLRVFQGKTDAIWTPTQRVLGHLPHDTDTTSDSQTRACNGGSR